MDSLDGQLTKEFREELKKNQDTLPWYFKPKCTDLLQPVDRHVAQMLKLLIAGNEGETIRSKSTVLACVQNALPVEETEYSFEIPGVYIEDTDSYQVVYYANYFKFCTRAIQDALGQALIASLLRNKGLALHILTIDSGKYAAAAVLGDALTVQSRVLSVTETSITWQQDIVSTSTQRLFVSAQVATSFLDDQGRAAANTECFMEDAALPRPTKEARDPEHPCPKAKPGTPSVRTRCTVYADEVSPSGVLSEHAVLRYFERNRTDLIGGASGLNELQQMGIIVVVARFNNFNFSTVLFIHHCAVTSA
ncbi:hypothetical protein CYMTET_53092 [Cymbomonas tetramitiformis]|uniref:Uncharacterized protein n=1 Tax=Cymbomonas tetramitiformis TaxID=36881 RepID=A0AAE0BHM0_9CHLO|nr:hypothetical protein CYMTET_53092 [Cymbomonas tetramitiformis]